MKLHFVGFASSMQAQLRQQKNPQINLVTVAAYHVSMVAANEEELSIFGDFMGYVILTETSTYLFSDRHFLVLLIDRARRTEKV